MRGALCRKLCIRPIRALPFFRKSMIMRCNCPTFTRLSWRSFKGRAEAASARESALSRRWCLRIRRKAPLARSAFVKELSKELYEATAGSTRKGRASSKSRSMVRQNSDNVIAATSRAPSSCAIKGSTFSSNEASKSMASSADRGAFLLPPCSLCTLRASAAHKLKCNPRCFGCSLWFRRCRCQNTRLLGQSCTLSCYS